MKKLKTKMKHTLHSMKIEEHYKKIMVALAFALLILVLNTDISFASSKPNTDQAWKAFMNEYRVILAGIAGFGAFTSLLVFIFHFIKLGTMPSHPIQRREVMNNMMISAITTALLGGISLVLSIFYSILFNPYS